MSDSTRIKKRSITHFSFKNWGRNLIYNFKKEFKKQYIDTPPKKVVQNMLLVIAGSIILAFNASILLVPADIISGGNSGIALVIAAIVKLCGGNLDAIGGVSTVIIIVTIFFFILGFFIVGLDFTLKTAVSTIVYPAFVWIFDQLREVPALHWIKLEEYFNGAATPHAPSAYPAVIAAGLIGGVLLGLGVALAFRGGGSTGGTDCLIIAISSRTRLQANTISIIIASTIILIGICIMQDLVGGIMGIIAAIICAFLIGRFFVGAQTLYTAQIISNRWKVISNQINKEMERGTTIFPARGGYTGTERYVVSVSFTREEYNDLLKLIQSIDPSAFVTITAVSEVQGHGFSLDDGDEPILLPEKSRSSTDNKKAKMLNEKAIKAKEKDIKKDVERVIKQDKKASKEADRANRTNSNTKR